MLDTASKGLKSVTTLKINHRVSLVIGSAAALIAAFAWAQNSEDVLVIDQPVDRDTYAAHREIEVRSSVDGDFVAVGRRITIDGDIAGDAIVAAQIIEILVGKAESIT